MANDMWHWGVKEVHDPVVAQILTGQTGPFTVDIKYHDLDGSGTVPTDARLREILAPYIEPDDLVVMNVP